MSKLAKDEPAKYVTFWKEFGAVLKEGVAEDYANREKLLPLLRFASTHEATDDDSVALADYVGRMKPGQQKIYYALADSRAAARGSPHLERLRARGVEVLLLGDRVDPWIMAQIGEFDGKSFQDVARGDLGLEQLEGEAGKLDAASEDPDATALCERIGQSLGTAVSAVRVSQRLTDSPSCLTRTEDEMSESMRRMLAASGRGDLPESKPQLEINVAHPLVQRLKSLQGEDFGELSQLLYDQAELTEQGHVANPGEYSRRLNRLLLRLLG